MELCAGDANPVWCGGYETIDIEGGCDAGDGVDDDRCGSSTWKQGGEDSDDEQNGNHYVGCGMFLVHGSGVSTDPGSDFGEAGLHGWNDEESDNHK